MPRAIVPADIKLYAMLSEPSFSPDGRRVAFSAKRADLEEDSYESDVYIADA